MDQRTPYQQLRQIDYAINRFGMAADWDTLDTNARRSFDTLKRSARRSQDILKDYEIAEFEEDTVLQARLLPRAVTGLEKLRADLLKASEYDIVGAVDIAQLSAQLDELIDRLH